jgi:hypothetical protein
LKVAHHDGCHLVVEVLAGVGNHQQPHDAVGLVRFLVMLLLQLRVGHVPLLELRLDRIQSILQLVHFLRRRFHQ